jgi:hypothetical protein
MRGRPGVLDNRLEAVQQQQLSHPHDSLIVDYVEKVRGGLDALLSGGTLRLRQRSRGARIGSFPRSSRHRRRRPHTMSASRARILPTPFEIGQVRV